MQRCTNATRFQSIKKLLAFSIFFLLFLSSLSAVRGEWVTFQVGNNQSSDVLIQSSYNWEKYITPNGTYKIISYAGIVNYEENGTFYPINTTINPSMGGVWNYEMTRSIYKAYFKQSFTSAQIVRLEKSGYFVQFQPHALQYSNDLDQIQQIAMPQNVNGFSDKNMITWQNAYGNGYNFSYICENSRLVKKLIILDRSYLPQAQSYIINGGNPVLVMNFIFSFSSSLKVYVDGVEWDKNSKRRTGNDIEFRDSNENVIWYFKEPYAVDSNGSVERAFLEVKKSGNSLYVSVLVNYSWLSNAVFPVEIDPTVEVAASDSGRVYGSNANYNTARTTAYSYAVGLGYVGQLYSSGYYYVYRSFLKFNTTSIPTNAYITSAVLKINGLDDYSTTDFYIKVQKWTGDVPIDNGDYNQYDNINYDNNGFYTSNFVTNGYNNIGLADFAVITKGGYTTICLRSSRDISATAPTGNEYISFLGTGSIKPPKLEITYSETPYLEVTASNTGYVFGRNSDYNTARTTPYTYALGASYVGQSYVSPNYFVYRSFLKFDTTSIPSNAQITSAVLKIYGQYDYSTTDFYIKVQKWTGDIPINTDDYNQYDGINYDNNGFYTSNFVTNTYNIITITNFSIITKGGYTMICLRSDRDISATAPTGSEYISYYGAGSSTPPKLVITYTVVTAEWKTIQSGWVKFSNTTNFNTIQTGWTKFSNVSTIRTIQTGWVRFSNTVTFRNIQSGWIRFSNTISFRNIQTGWVKFSNISNLKTIQSGWTRFSNTVTFRNIQSGWVKFSNTVTFRNVQSGWVRFSNTVTFRTIQAGWVKFSNTSAFKNIQDGWVTFIVSEKTWKTIQSGWVKFSNTIEWSNIQTGWVRFSNTVSFGTIQSGWVKFSNVATFRNVQSGWVRFSNTVSFKNIQSGWVRFSNVSTFKTIQTGWVEFSSGRGWISISSGWVKFSNVSAWNNIEGGWVEFSISKSWRTIRSGWVRFSSIVDIVIRDVLPEDGSIIYTTSPACIFTIESMKGRLMNYSIYLSLDGENFFYEDGKNNISNGTYYFIYRIATYYNRTYFWKLRVDDGNININKTFSFSLKDRNEEILGETKNVGGKIMDIGDGISLLMILTLLGILVVKMLNTMSVNTFYDKKYIFVTFVVGLFSYLILLLTTITKHTLLYAMYLNVGTVMFLIVFILFIAEILISLGRVGYRERYKPRERLR